ncbi:MAG: hypothetical protein IJW70_08910 [Clostridia bacterium]|nr:hypothetical protein [Clostridia bacterium]
MKTFYRYLVYRLKNSAIRTLILSALLVAVCLVGINECNTSRYVEGCQSGLYMLAIALCVTASIVPLFELSGLKNRRNLDTLYFFPIKRSKLALVHFVSGWIQVIVIYSFTFVASYLWLALQTDYFALGYMFVYYVLSLLLAFVIYSVFSFLFIQANTVADGVLFCALWIFLPALVAVTWDFVFEYELAGKLSGWGILYTPMNNLTVLYQDLIEINHPSRWDSNAEAIHECWYMFFFWGAVGIAAAQGYVVSFVKKGAERAGEISNSLVGYKTLIPIYGYCYMLLTGVGFQPILMLFYLIFMLSGYLIYRRGFKFKLIDIITTVVGFILPVLLLAAKG